MKKLQRENEALRKEVEALHKENADLKANNAQADHLFVIPILPNGYKSKSKGTKTKTTDNTCAFDSFFMLYAVVVTDQTEFRTKFIDSKTIGPFCRLVKGLLDEEKSAVLEKRNDLLGKYYTKKIKGMLDCTSSIGETFNKICETDEMLNSFIVIGKCTKCGKLGSTKNSFVCVDAKKFNVENIQPSIIEKLPLVKCDQCRLTMKSVVVVNEMIIIDADNPDPSNIHTIVQHTLI